MQVAFNTFEDQIRSSKAQITLGRGTTSSALNYGTIKVGIGIQNPQYPFHLHQKKDFGAPPMLLPAYMGITNFTTGSTGNDGLRLGIDENGVAEVNQQEDLPLLPR